MAVKRKIIRKSEKTKLADANLQLQEAGLIDYYIVKEIDRTGYYYVLYRKPQVECVRCKELDVCLGMAKLYM